MQIDLNKPVENPKLKELLIKRQTPLAVEEADHLLSRILEEIAMNAHFLSVIHMDHPPKLNGDGTATFEKDCAVSFAMITSKDGRIFYPAFMDWDELYKWQEVRGSRPNTAVLSFDDYASRVLDQRQANGIIINPCSDCLVIDSNLMSELRNRKYGLSKNTVEKGSTIRLGEPADYPHAMIQAIVKNVGAFKSIRTMWLQLMEIHGSFRYLIIVDATEDFSEICGRMACAAQPHLNNKVLDIIPLSNIGEQAISGINPFYNRAEGKEPN